MDVVVQHAPRFDRAEAEALAQREFGLIGRAEPLPSERDQNFRLTTGDGRTVVLKIANATERLEILEFQNAALEHLAKRQPSLAVPRVCRSTSGETVVRVPGAAGREHFVRMLSWVPGTVLAQVSPHTQALLASLGRLVGETNRAFAGFSHPAMGRVLQWDLLRTPWIAAELGRVVDSRRRAVLERVLGRFASEVAPRVHSLPAQVIHNDWNDYNVLVTPKGTADREATGVVDFGDMVRSPIVADLAVACAYAMLGKADPLGSAAEIVRGFHEILPLADDERDVLLDLIRARLAISVTMAACQSAAAPANDYLLISQQQAWSLLEHLDAVDPMWARCVFRQACGLPACASSAGITAWLSAHSDDVAPVLGHDLRDTPLVVFDLSVGSLDIPRPEIVQETPAFGAHVERIMADSGATIGIGRYDEPRLVYVTELFRHANNWCDENRTVHLGIDLFCAAGAPVYAPLDGTVHSCANNAAAGDYGPTIILEHLVDNGAVRFFTLYGHLSASSLDGMAPGRLIARGERIARLGDPSVNGGWPPHLHFQIVADMLGRAGEFPGVASPSERGIWLSLCPDANLIVGVPADKLPPRPIDPATILAARRQLLGRNLSVSYRRPIAMARGYRQYLYDVDGRRYLDGVNNVPHVGHCHPRVVEAAARQLTVLNTNTRYLHEGIVRYADRLRALMPAPLSVCYFVCSGSEANELALRLARAYTRRRDIVVVDVAYHGNTTTLVEISPYKFAGPGGAGRAPYVHPVVMPDTYRGPYRAGDPLAGARYAAEVARAIERAESDGREVAAFICESLPGCGGQIVLPDGYLAGAYAAVREAGGVAIADEVQVGFGRVGTHIWGFETQGVTPDIVTLGKPIGNGFPLGAVVTTPEIAEAFDNGMEYFNTFGGTQAACAAGLAVLDVMRDEQLQAHALEIGARLKRGLSSLMADFPLVGDVRGLGLFLGVELVTDRESLEPAGSQADYIINRLRDRGVLVSTDGPLHNVLKIKPPLPFSADDGDRLVTTLRDILSEDPAQPTVLQRSPASG
jgi:4-aminobutyrate aminotransferase-like enzyme/Ser/Thr protein kinase RdoA (MazF antagonist)/murein DD-endopeptidase MepM/ murein hydrolase activator NlpD